MCILPFPNGRIYPPLYCTTWTDFSKNNEYEKNFFMKYAGDINDLLSKMEKHDVFIISKGFGVYEQCLSLPKIARRSMVFDTNESDTG